MKIGILGSGNMGRSLGALWAEQGHDVFFGSRSVEKGSQIAKQVGLGAKGGSNDQAAAFGEVLLYTIRGIDPADVLTSVSVLDGKVLIDCNNFDIPEGFAYEPINQSLAERLAAQVPNAVVVKAFNTMAQEVFELSPEPLAQYSVSVFLASDDAEAKQTVSQLAEEIGFNPLDCGPLRQSRLIEGLGDFIRLMIISQGLGPYTTVSVNVLPAAEQERLGGRQPSLLH